MTMIARRLVFLLVLFAPMSLWAQRQRTPKPVLLVYGASAEAFAAAVQSAKSSVPTLWVVPEQEPIPEFATAAMRVESNDGFDSGVWRDLLLEIADPKRQVKGSVVQTGGGDEARMDSLVCITKRMMTDDDVHTAVQALLQELEQPLSTLSMLSVKRAVEVAKISRNKRFWQIALTDKSKFSIRTIVDASREQSLRSKVGAGLRAVEDESIRSFDALTAGERRTIVAVAKVDEQVLAATVQDILRQEDDSFFSTQVLRQYSSDAEIPLRMQYGQAVGAAAAFTAFFKTTADKIDVRKLQGELLAFQARLSAFEDVSRSDRNFRALERIGLVNVFSQQDHLFRGDDLVSHAQVAAAMNSKYSRSQIWFAQNKGENFTLRELLSLLKFVGLRADDLDRQVEKEWNSKFGFEDFNLDREVTRKEFSVLLDAYAKPFSITVDKDGQFIR